MRSVLASRGVARRRWYQQENHCMLLANVFETGGGWWGTAEREQDTVFSGHLGHRALSATHHQTARRRSDSAYQINLPCSAIWKSRSNLLLPATGTAHGATTHKRE